MKIIDFKEALNSKAEKQAPGEIKEEEIPVYKENEYKDNLSLKEILELMEITQTVLKMYNNAFRGDKVVYTPMESYKEFLEGIIKNYLRFRFSYLVYEEMDKTTIDTLLDIFKQNKIRNAQEYIIEIKTNVEI